MRCNICDAVISTPQWNGQLVAWEPCTTCLDIINHVFEDTPEPLSLEEDESLEDVEDYSSSESLGDSLEDSDELVGKDNPPR